MRNPDFIKSLVAKGIFSVDEAKSLRSRHNTDDYALLLALLKDKKIGKVKLGMMWGDSLGLSYVDLEKTLFQRSVLKKVDEKIARNYNVIPIYEMADTITLAVSNPENLTVLDDIKRSISKPISPVFAFPHDISNAIEVNYQSEGSLKDMAQTIPVELLKAGSDGISEEQLIKIAGDKAIIDFARSLLLLAIKERASDIHFEPDEDIIRARFRVDGVLQERLKLEKSLQAPLISRFKIMANVDITEKRRPQDGRINIDLSHKSIGFRFSTIPTIYGEKIVMRVLGQIEKTNIPSLEELELAKPNYDLVKKVINSPNGVFFVTGPTGSGKTTTLFSVLSHINSSGVNVMTIEDPVEYRLPGIYQVQVNPGIDFGFPDALRAFLRQDPDVILIGEIRDAETAKIASQAALTGHLVLATMHTNNSLQAVTRLIEIGVEPFLVAPSIIGVMAQRLVRRICVHCKERYALPRQEIDKYFLHDGNKEVFFYRGKGCDECHGSGYSGRVAIHEVFIMNEEVRELVAKSASILEIKRCADKLDFQSMRYDGIKKVLRGLTTIEEVEKASFSEEFT